MKAILDKQRRLARRKVKVRGKISGTSTIPRLAVSKSNTSIYAQLIDDIKGVTMLGLHSKSLSKGKNITITDAEKLGEVLAIAALEKNIYRAVFDRRGRKYTGKIAAFAEGARKSGLRI
jgi:large subunit ribosomal protein L18